MMPTQTEMEFNSFEDLLCANDGTVNLIWNPQPMSISVWEITALWSSTAML